MATLALFADGSREYIDATRNSRTWVVADGPFTQEQLADIRADLEVSRDADMDGRHDLAEHLRSEARRKRQEYRTENEHVAWTFTTAALALVFEERDLRWREYGTPAELYGPVESPEWTWEDFDRLNPPGRWMRLEWRLVEDGAPCLLRG